MESYTCLGFIAWNTLGYMCFTNTRMCIYRCRQTFKFKTCCKGLRTSTQFINMINKQETLSVEPIQLRWKAASLVLQL